jgi:hypothetical protein
MLGYRRAVNVFTVTSDSSTIYFFNGRFVGRLNCGQADSSIDSTSVNFEARIDLCLKDHDSNFRHQNSLKSLIDTYSSLNIIGDIHGSVRPPHAGTNLVAISKAHSNSPSVPVILELGSKFQAVVTTRSIVEVIAELDGESYHLPSRFRIACMPALIHLWCDR